MRFEPEHKKPSLSNGDGGFEVYDGCDKNSILFNDLQVLGQSKSLITGLKSFRVSFSCEYFLFHCVLD